MTDDPLKSYQAAHEVPWAVVTSMDLPCLTLLQPVTGYDSMNGAAALHIRPCPRGTWSRT